MKPQQAIETTQKQISLIRLLFHLRLLQPQQINSYNSNQEIKETIDSPDFTQNAI